jgi:PTS system mannose-specific IID component
MNTIKLNSKQGINDVAITKKDLFKSWFIWFNFHTAGWNWERMQHIAFTLYIEPILKKLYKNDKEKYIERLTSHMKFFNSEPQSSTLIHGITVALEEQKARGEDVSADAIDSLKAGMMGPLAGLGDSMVAALLNALLLSIGIGLAMDGNILGPIILVLGYSIVVTSGSWWIFKKGYDLGLSSISTLVGSKISKKFTEAMGVLGLVVIGGLSAGLVGITTELAYRGDATVEVQKILDGIMPGLLPLLLTLGVYYLLAKKNIPTVKVMLLIFVAGFILSSLRII